MGREELVLTYSVAATPVRKDVEVWMQRHEP